MMAEHLPPAAVPLPMRHRQRFLARRSAEHVQQVYEGPRYKSLDEAWAEYQRGDRFATEYVERQFALQDWERKLRPTVYGTMVNRLILNRDMTPDEIGSAVLWQVRMRLQAVGALLAFFAPLRKKRRKRRRK